MPSTSFQSILDAALADYANQIGIDLAKHPSADRLQVCRSPDDVMKLLEDKANEFKDYRDGNRELIDRLKPVVNVIHAFSGVLGEAVSFVPFQPAGAIFAGVDILFAAASDVSSSYDALVDLFECLGTFLKRLRIYTDLPLTPPMTDIVVKTMVELLSVLALATKQAKQGRFKKFAKKLLGDSEIEAVLRRLDRLTQEEGRMAVAQTLEVVHGLMEAMKVVMNDGKASMDAIWRALDMMQQMADDINKIRRDQLQKESRTWLSPPDPSPNYDNACEIQKDGTATWFFEGNVFTEWNEKGPLLWIHGKPGSGKSILMSSIIREIDRMRKAGFASMAYFYFDFRDTQKQHKRGLLSSLLSQLSAESDPCYHILSQLFSAHAGGTRQPSDRALSDLLFEMLEVQGRPAMYIIIDALDECPNTSGMPTPREKVLEFLVDLVDLQLRNVHICISSRPEFDIRTYLEPLKPLSVSLDDETGQKADILGYITSAVHSDRRMRRWSAEDQQLVISTLSDKADGMFRWVYCQLEILRRCFPSSIRETLVSLPKTLDATYEHMLLGIDEEKWQSAHRLLQCLAVSTRPLCVEELAEITAFRFDKGALPQFDAGWRLSDAEEAVLSACSSLITITNVNGSRIVQFAHFSVKEYLTSDRLATASENISRYHISPHSAHTTLAQASLGVLLQLDGRIDKESIRKFPLADYAARHWIDHCRLGDMSSMIQNSMKCLFDRERPHFSAWVWIWDIDDPWQKPMSTANPVRPEASPLYYAILCGFLWLIEHLIITYPGDVDTRGGFHETPLLAALRKEGVDVTSSSTQHDAGVYALKNGDMNPLRQTSSSERVDIVRLLLEHNANFSLANKEGETPLDRASAIGILEISRLLVGRGANVHLRDNDGWTPLHTASYHGQLGAVQFLISSGADVNTHNRGWTPLHLATRWGHIGIVELLSQHGADVNKQNHEQETPLTLASANGKLEILRLLIQGGADVHARDKDNWTSLHTASTFGHLDAVQFLIDSGADVNALDNKGGGTPLHLAILQGQVNIVELLIKHGADINKHGDRTTTPLNVASALGKLEIVRLLVQGGARTRDKNDWTPLNAASHNGHLNVAQYLIDGGADVNPRGWTPLHSASQQGHINIVDFLIQHDADVNPQDNEGRTPLHLASGQGHIDIVDFLIRHGADVNKKHNNQGTPLDEASLSGKVEISRLLVQAGADVRTRNKNDWTPLETASHKGHLDVARFLIDSGADVNSQDNGGLTPLHSASRQGHINIVQLLIEHDADVNKQNNDKETPLDGASSSGKVEISRLLVQAGADVQARNKNDWTPLKTASHKGYLDVAQFLLDSGANVNPQDNEGRTPLHSAASNAHFDVVKLLLERGADISIRDNRNRTPLDLAFENGHPQVTEFLSSHVEGSMSLNGTENLNTPPSTVGPQSSLPNVMHSPGKREEDATSSEEESPSLYTASKNGQLDIVRSLLDRGSDVNERYDNRATSLDAASTSGYLEVAKLLIESGADVDSRDWDGCTPLISASGRGHSEVARLLLDRGADVNAQMRGPQTALHAAVLHFETAQLLLGRGANVGIRNADGETPREIAQRLGYLRVVELLAGFEGTQLGHIESP